MHLNRSVGRTHLRDAQLAAQSSTTQHLGFHRAQSVSDGSARHGGFEQPASCARWACQWLMLDNAIEMRVAELRNWPLRFLKIPNYSRSNASRRLYDVGSQSRNLFARSPIGARATWRGLHLERQRLVARRSLDSQ